MWCTNLADCRPILTSNRPSGIIKMNRLRFLQLAVIQSHRHNFRHLALPHQAFALDAILLQLLLRQLQSPEHRDVLRHLFGGLKEKHLQGIIFAVNILNQANLPEVTALQRSLELESTEQISGITLGDSLRIINEFLGIASVLRLSYTSVLLHLQIFRI